MSLATRVKRLQAQVRGLRTATEPVPDSLGLLRAAGMTPDVWQRALLRDNSQQTLLMAARQSGKTQVVMSKVLAEALAKPRQLVLIMSPTLRQSGEAFRTALLPLWRQSGQPRYKEPPSRLELNLSNGSRVVALPESEANVRGFSKVTHLVLDEAARVDDDLYKAVRPFLAVSRGKLTAMTTPFGQRGWFFEAFTGPGDWHRVKAPASFCPRLSSEFLNRERLDLGDAWYAQEYEPLDFISVQGALWPAIYWKDTIWFDEWPELKWARSVPNGILSIDTSFGRTNSDFQAVLYCRYTPDWHCWTEAFAYRLDDDQLYNKIIEHCRVYNPTFVVVEVNDIGRTLFARLKRDRIMGVPIPVKGRYHSENKEYRIRKTLTRFLSRELMHIRRTPGGRELIVEGQSFPVGDRDDLLDSWELNVELFTQAILPIDQQTVEYAQ